MPKYKSTASVVMMACLLLPASAADGFTPNQKGPGQPVTYSVESNADYAGKIERRLDALYQEYQQFEFKIGFLKDDAAGQIKERLREWNVKRQEAVLMIEKLRFSTENTWETDKIKINSSIDELDKSLSEMRSKAFSNL